MTDKEKFEATEKREAIFERDNYTCQACGVSIRLYGSSQLAHIVSKSKANLKKYGKHIIHSEYNLKSACSISCNASLACGRSHEAEHARYVRRMLANE